MQGTIQDAAQWSFEENDILSWTIRELSSGTSISARPRGYLKPPVNGCFSKLGLFVDFFSGMPQEIFFHFEPEGWCGRGSRAPSCG